MYTSERKQTKSGIKEYTYSEENRKTGKQHGIRENAMTNK